MRHCAQENTLETKVKIPYSGANFIQPTLEPDFMAKKTVKEPSVVEKLMNLADTECLWVRDVVKYKSLLKRAGIKEFTQDQVMVAEHRLRKEIDKLIGPYTAVRKTQYDDLPDDLKHELGIVSMDYKAPSQLPVTSRGGELNGDKRTKSSTPPKQKTTRKRDRYGSFEGTGSAAINSCLTMKPITAEQIAAKIGLNKDRVNMQLRWLLERELIVLTPKGYVTGDL